MLVDTIGILSVLRMRGLHDKRHLLAKLHICGSKNCSFIVMNEIEERAKSLLPYLYSLILRVVFCEILQICIIVLRFHDVHSDSLYEWKQDLRAVLKAKILSEYHFKYLYNNTFVVL